MVTGTRQIKTAFWAIDIALVAATAFFTVGGIMHLSESSSLANVAPPPLVDSASPKTAGEQSKVGPRGEFQSLAKSSLFGKQSRANVPPPAIEEVLPETTLDHLELLGVVVEDGGVSGFAIIRNSKEGGSVDTYMVGDFIVGGDARVMEIRAREVVLLQSGGQAGDEERLPLLFSAKKAGRKGRGGFPGGRPPARSRRPRSRQKTSKEAISVINENERRINMARLMEQAGQNLTSLLADLQTSPKVVDGKESGISVDQVGSDPISSRAGIRSGDVVKSINEKKVNSINDIIRQSERLKNASEIRVVIERNGRQRTLVYKIN